MANLLKVRRWPQPDYPDVGWINAALPAPVTFDVAWTPGIQQLVQTYRVPKRLQFVYGDQPISGQTPSLWEVWFYTSVSTQQAFQSYRMVDKPPDRLTRYTDFPEFNWLKVPVNLWEVEYFPAVHSETLSFRMPEPKIDFRRRMSTLWEDVFHLAQTTVPTVSFSAVQRILWSFIDRRLRMLGLR